MQILSDPTVSATETNSATFQKKKNKNKKKTLKFKSQLASSLKRITSNI